MFLKDALAGWIGLVLAPIAYSLIRRRPAPELTGVPAPASLGSVADFDFQSSRTVYLGDTKVIVARDAKGLFHAVSAVCTHLGCSIRFAKGDEKAEFACNCHNSKFALDGMNLSGPATYPLAKYDIDLKAGRVMVSARKHGIDEAP